MTRLAEDIPDPTLRKMTMVCVACYAQSQGATMSEAVVVFKGETVCSKHLEARAREVEEAMKDRPTVTPH